MVRKGRSAYTPGCVQDGAGAVGRVADHHGGGQAAGRVHNQVGQIHLVALEVITDKAGGLGGRQKMLASTQEDGILLSSKQKAFRCWLKGAGTLKRAHSCVGSQGR